MSNGGKGSKPRPFSVSHDEWSNRWDAIFQRDVEESDESDSTEKSTEDTVANNFVQGYN